MKIRYFLAISWFVCFDLQAVDCVPDDIALESQQQVDDFQLLHGPCDAVVDDLRVRGEDIANVDGLSGTIAPEIADLQCLNSLELFDNLLTGEIPEPIGRLSIGPGREISIAANRNDTPMRFSYTNQRRSPTELHCH